ncbi:MAG: hypothetical protein QM773_03660 [Hyphomonadaceae bacterium]
MPDAKPVYHVHVTPDGRTATFTTSEGEKTESVTIPAEKLPHVMAMLSQAASAAQSKQVGQRSYHIQQIEKWRILPHPDEAAAVLQIVVPGGIESSYRLEKQYIPRMIEALQSILAAPKIPQTKN